MARPARPRAARAPAAPSSPRPVLSASPRRRARERDVVVEDVLVAALLVAGVPPPVCEELAGRGDHRRHEDEQLGGDARADERRREAAERVPHDNEVAAIADCLDDRVGVLPPAGRARPRWGRSTATGSWPCSRSSDETRCQSHEVPPPPWMSANVDTETSPAAVTASRRRARAPRRRAPVPFLP